MRLLPALLLPLVLFPLGSPPTIRQDDDFKPTIDKSAKDGYYIPKDLDDALQELDNGFSSKVKAHIMAMKRQDDMAEFHMGFGMWMRNNWGLWTGSRLYIRLAKLGLSQPDDMSGLILEEYWRKLHNLPLDTTKYVADMKAYWEGNVKPPDSKCPWDGSPLEVGVGLMGREAVPGFKGTIWAARCKHGHLWTWFYKKGWYRPEGSVLKEIHDSERQQKD